MTLLAEPPITPGDPEPAAPELRDELCRILAAGSVRTVFQPIVDLDSGSVVGYEALSRGPAGPLERPDALFASAREAGRLAELDALCRVASVRSAVTAGLATPATLFVNVEPETLDVAALESLVGLADSVAGGPQIVLEITERSIAANPAGLLATVGRLRQAGWRVALDDVGADDMSLAFMPLLRPDIVKLDLAIVQRRPGRKVAEIMHAVNAYAEQSGATLLAEGIETEEHRFAAQALGARLGQGWMFGRPEPTLAHASAIRPLMLSPDAGLRDVRSPFEALPDGAVRRSTKPLLLAMTLKLEHEALRHGSTCVLLSTFEESRHFTRRTAARYRSLVGDLGFVAAMAHGKAPSAATGLRWCELTADDPVRAQWDVVVLAPHFAGALLARDLGDRGPDSERRFDVALTYDRTVVTEAARSLMSRLRP